MLKKLANILTGRIVIFGTLIILQILIIVLGTAYLAQYYAYVMFGLQALSLIIVVYIISKRDNPMYKIIWIIAIMLLPVLGGVFYLLFGKKSLSRKIHRYLETCSLKMKAVLRQEPQDVSEEIKKIDADAYKQVTYLKNKAFVPVYKNTSTRLLTPGEKKWKCMLEELEKAERYIFLEYFIINDGIMWKSVLDILKRKVASGVTVRLMYDDMGSIHTLEPDFAKQMNDLGIECRVFNPFKPSPDAFMNYRDHRKICVIDGNVGITGGINLADEYINAYEKYGHWKDTSIILKGDAVWTLTILFLQLWNNGASDDDVNYLDYKPNRSFPTDGFVQPFGDSPLDDDLIGEMMYMHIINNAKKYVYVQTPYLILDNEMMTALMIAAQSGIDVRIITPYVPDKWFVHMVTQANYDVLVHAGVKIYEYTPGFIHAKTIVSDDNYAIVGTTNFDFRSFYLHFECGVYLFQASCVLDVRDDFLKTQEISHQITEESCRKVRLSTKIGRAILRVFSPLM